MRQQEKLRFYKMAFDYLANNQLIGDYWEFGCHRARTFRMAMQESYKREWTRNNVDFVAFDSFEGLPDHKEKNVMKNWKQGALKTPVDTFKKLISKLPNYERVIIIKKFYSELPINIAPSDPIFVNLDCDLYQSTKDALRIVMAHLSNGMVIYLDDYYAGSMPSGMEKAWKESTKNHKDFEFVEWMDIGWWGKSFLVKEK